MAGEPTDGAPVRTLGERLTEQGRALAARHLPAFPWSGPLAVAMQRAASLDMAHEERFARVEVDTHARRPVWPAGARPRRPAEPVPAPGVAGTADVHSALVGPAPTVAPAVPAAPAPDARAPASAVSSSMARPPEGGSAQAPMAFSEPRTMC